MIRLVVTASAAALLLAGCSHTGESSPAAGAKADTSHRVDPGPTTVDRAFARSLAEKLVVPPMPSFTLPTDLLTSAQDRSIAAALRLQPGLYRGIAVLDARCGPAGSPRPVDSGPGTSATGHFSDGRRNITVASNGTGVYDAPGLHIAVLAGGAGVYDDGTTRVSVEADGAGTSTSAGRRYTVRADGSGSYRDATTRVSVGRDGAGSYQDGNLRVTLTAAGATFGHGDPGRVAEVTRVLRARLPRFPPVPAVRRVAVTGTSCGTVIRLDANVLFDFGTAGLRPEAAVLLARVGRLLLTLKSPPARVNGFTDHIGSSAANADLSRLRADGVRAALVRSGVRAGSLTAYGLGESHPVRPEVLPAGGDDPAARQLDRRVEVVLLDR